MSVWFTSDTHFDHRFVASLRGFDTAADHDQAIVENWNAVVRPGDQVWHLGDVGMGRIARFEGALRQLHGEIHLITGNHDECAPGVFRDAHKHQRAWMGHFTSIQPYARRKIGGQPVLLCHYPYRGDHTHEERHTRYRLPDEGLWLLHGHVHSEWRLNGRQFNVGVDVNDLAPVHLDTVATLVSKAAAA